MLLLIFAREILARKPGATFIGEVKCSQVLYDEIQKLGGKGIMYRTGHSLIKAKMKEEHAEMAGEMSGHLFFADRYRGYDDALYAACRLIEIVARSGQPLSAQLAVCPKWFQRPRFASIAPTRSSSIWSSAWPIISSRSTARWISMESALFFRTAGIAARLKHAACASYALRGANEHLLKQYQSEVEQVLEEARAATARS